AKMLMQRALDDLGPDDAFRMVRFDSGTSELSNGALDATAENIERGRRFVDQMSASGGTEMEAGLKAAFAPSVEYGRMRMVVMLTDGYIGSDRTAIQLVSDIIGESRIFTVGVGSSPNRYLLDELATMGRGAAHYIDYDEAPDEIVKVVYERMRR